MPKFSAGGAERLENNTLALVEERLLVLLRDQGVSEERKHDLIETWAILVDMCADIRSRKYATPEIEFSFLNSFYGAIEFSYMLGSESTSEIGRAARSKGGRRRTELRQDEIAVWKNVVETSALQARTDHPRASDEALAFKIIDKHSPGKLPGPRTVAGYVRELVASGKLPPGPPDGRNRKVRKLGTKLLH